MRVERFRRSCVVLVSVSLLSLGLQAPAVAGIIGTADVIAAAAERSDLAVIRDAFANAEVRERLVALGVDPAAVDGRLAALSSTELATLADNIERVPAGGSVLAIVGIVFLVLLLLEYTGTIDIFKKVP